MIINNEFYLYPNKTPKGNCALVLKENTKGTIISILFDNYESINKNAPYNEVLVGCWRKKIIDYEFRRN